MDIESRAIKRQKQEQQALRKTAAGIAKEVSQLVTSLPALARAWCTYTMLIMPALRMRSHLSSLRCNLELSRGMLYRLRAFVRFRLMRSCITRR